MTDLETHMNEIKNTEEKLFESNKKKYIKKWRKTRHSSKLNTKEFVFLYKQWERNLKAFLNHFLLLYGCYYYFSIFYTRCIFFSRSVSRVFIQNFTVYFHYVTIVEMS